MAISCLGPPKPDTVVDSGGVEQRDERSELRGFKTSATDSGRRPWLLLARIAPVSGIRQLHCTSNRDSLLYPAGSNPGKARGEYRGPVVAVRAGPRTSPRRAGESLIRPDVPGGPGLGLCGTRDTSGLVVGDRGLEPLTLSV